MIRNNFHKSNTISFQAVIVMMIAVIFIGSIIFSLVNIAHAETYSDCVVSDKSAVAVKDSANKSNGNTEYRIYTENCGTFTVNDSILIFQFNSADLYGQINVGESYDFETKGYRIPIVSSFPNINSISQ